MNQNFHVLNKQAFSKKIDFIFFFLIIPPAPALASASSEVTRQKVDLNIRYSYKWEHKMEVIW